MKPDEIKRIAAQVLAGVDRILNHWLPGGKIEGHEYQALNPKRSDSSLGSFSINTRTGEWADFATGDKGKDLVSLVAYLADATQSDAAKMVAELLGIAIEQNAPQNRGRNAPKDAGKGKASPQPKESNSAQPGKNFANVGWGCVMPIPDDAPPPPEAHPKHGKYDQRYPYLNIDGRVNYYHDRWEPKEAGGKKQFAPLTLWRKDGRFKWQFKAPPEPRPLYGLPSLVQYPDAWVWIVEGEKAAKALGKLLPSHPVLSWQGGSMAVDKSDYQPLKGCRIRIWPDNDQAGEKATENLIKQLQQAGASEIEVLNLDRLSCYVPAYIDTGKESIPKIDRTGITNMHAGDDAHDLLTRDRWTAEHFHLLLTLGVPDLFLSNSQDIAQQTTQAISQEEATESGIPESPKKEYRPHFEIKDHGVLHLQQDKEGKIKPRKICGKLEVLAQSRDPNSSQWGKLVQFSDPDNRLKRIIIPARAFNGDGLDATGRLLEEGLAIMPKARALVLQYLQEQCPSERVRTTNRTGWHGINDDLVFVLPDGSIGQSDDEWLFADARPDSSLFRQRGTLEQWRDHVAVLCSGNSRLTFAVSVAFAAPLLHLIEMESGGFHYRGTTSSGKTSALYMAGSVCGSPEYLQRWRSTDNGLESTALSHCDAILTLDELKMIDARIAGESAYMLANGSAKVRANQNGGARNTAKWRLLFLSAGELSLSQHVAEVGKRTPTGAELRMADIPADAGQGMGCFENLHGYANGHEFAKALGVTVNKYYGTAFPAFVEQILKNRESLRDSLADARLKFEKATLTSAASGQAQRVGARFALVGAAGELASHWGITGWQQGASMQAAMTCFKSWLQAFGGEGNKEERAMIEQVRHFLELHGEARFTDIDRSVVEDNHTPRTMNKAGFREKNAEGNLEYYCYPEVFKAEICKGFDHQAIARLLIARGFMKGDGKHLKPKVNLPGEGRKRVFHILPTIWGDEND